MAVSMKRSRQSTTALVREVCPFVLMQLLIRIHHFFIYGCVTFEQNICCMNHLICNLIHLHFSSGAMTRPQPPTCCSCRRSRGANLSVCALNRQSVRTPALHCTREYRSSSNTLYFVFTSDFFLGYPSYVSYLLFIYYIYLLFPSFCCNC